MSEDRDTLMLEFVNSLQATNNRLVAELERLAPVIEAAKAWWDDDDRSPKYAQFLGMALEALQAAEGE
jgi:hypothetical protein